MERVIQEVNDGNGGTDQQRSGPRPLRRILRTSSDRHGNQPANLTEQQRISNLASGSEAFGTPGWHPEGTTTSVQLSPSDVSEFEQSFQNEMARQREALQARGWRKTVERETQSLVDRGIDYDIAFEAVLFSRLPSHMGKLRKQLYEERQTQIKAEIQAKREVKLKRRRGTMVAEGIKRGTLGTLTEITKTSYRELSKPTQMLRHYHDWIDNPTARSTIKNKYGPLDTPEKVADTGITLKELLDNVDPESIRRKDYQQSIIAIKKEVNDLYNREIPQEQEEDSSSGSEYGGYTNVLSHVTMVPKGWTGR